MKFDKSILLKNLTGIFCGALILSMLLPFVKFGTSTEGVSVEAPVLKGINIVTDGGFVGILFFPYANSHFGCLLPSAAGSL